MGVRWIVGIDGSHDSSAALQWALSHSAGRDVDVDVVHVDHVPVTSRLLSTVTRRDPSHESDDAERLSDLDAATADIVAGRHVGHRIARGSPGHSLVAEAEQAALLIVGRHGAGGWQHTLGSVSRYCATHSATPTVVVPPTWEPGPTTRIVVGFDGSEHAAAALRWAIEFGGPDVDLRAIVAIEVAPWLRDDIVQLRLGDELRVEEQRLRDALHEVDPDGRAHAEIVVRGARPALARAAETADLVVVGGCGAGWLGTVLMGSVVTWMLDGSPTPIAVVRAAPPDESTQPEGID
jgi:nucleotide-binding universal stress UspA family protein